MVNRPDSADLWFLLGDDTDDQVVMYGHRSMVCSRCRHLRELVERETAVQEKEGRLSLPLKIHIPGVQHEALLGILYYLYTGDTMINTRNVDALQALAKEWHEEHRTGTMPILSRQRHQVATPDGRRSRQTASRV